MDFPKYPFNWDTCQELQELQKNSIKSNEKWNGRFQIKLNKNFDKNSICRKFAFKYLKIINEYEKKILYIAKYYWSREVSTFIIDKKKNLPTTISATDL